MALAQVTDATFEQEVVNASGTTLVDFWAEWCGPCRMIAPILETLATELKGTVKILKLNIDENPNTPSKLGISSIPTLMIFKDGKAVSTKIGNLPKNTISEWVQSFI
ncbi:MAG: thioredoxin [Alphaproteobacteria bacterium]|nr:thioredoxin [Alphaproteobacteria bacterium]MBT5389107.1 thioredoxin [Alphaproteobacteria bacterium]MBT5654311.1 thioredoxin [Alphaproteobacteria bacterium]